MAFIHISGPARADPFAKQASIAIAANSVLGFSGNGYVEQAEAASTRVAGVSLRKVASTDGDYASNTTISVIVPSEEDIFLADVDTGTAAQSNVGKRYDLATNVDGTAQGITLSGTTYGVVTVVGVVSTTKVLVKFNGYFANADISS